MITIRLAWSAVTPIDRQADFQARDCYQNNDTVTLVQICPKQTLGAKRRRYTLIRFLAQSKPFNDNFRSLPQRYQHFIWCQ